MLFITAEKARARGEEVKRCQRYERQRAKASGSRSLAHTRWSGGRRYLRRGRWRRREACEWEGRVCAREALWAPLMFRLILRGCGLGEDVADLKFEPGVKSRAAEAEVVLPVLRMLNSEAAKKRTVCLERVDDARTSCLERAQAVHLQHQHTSAYVSIRQHTSAYVSMRHCSIRQHTSAYVSIREHTRSGDDARTSWLERVQAGDLCWQQLHHLFTDLQFGIEIRAILRKCKRGI